MLLSHARLAEPWPKFAAIIGALVAVAVFEQSPVLVILAFVYGLVCADTVVRLVPKPWGFARVLLVGMGVAVASVFALSQLENQNVWQYWVQQVTQSAEAFSAQWKVSGVDPGVDWQRWKQVLIYQGPFQYLTILLLTFWIAVGAAAHFAWTDPTGPWSAASLKAIPLLKTPSFVFLGLFVVVALRIVPEFAGLLGVGLGWMFVQGTIVLARWLGQRQLTRQQRTLAYCLSIFPGFHAVIGLGVIGPWFRFREEIK
jgi:hypothetical protein